MKLAGRTWTRAQIMERVGDISQIAGIQPGELTEGKARGMRVLGIRTGSGLCCSVLPDRALDIANMELSGLAASYITKAGLVAPACADGSGYEWLRAFTGGMLTTCGLTHVGSPEKDGLWELGLHGRISQTPAQEVSHRQTWDGDELLLTIEGNMREAVLYEENLLLSRHMTWIAGDDRVCIHDTVENQGYIDTPLMLLYHINLGFPLLDETSRMIAPIQRTIARDEPSLMGMATCTAAEAPSGSHECQVFFHEMACDEQGWVKAAMINPTIPLAFILRYRKDQLPCFTQWKMMGQQDYVMGLEPGTCHPIGRSAAKAEGELMWLKPGERHTIELELQLTQDPEIIQTLLSLRP